MHDFSYISKRQSDFAILRGFYFHETSHMRIFAKINRREYFRIHSLTYLRRTVARRSTGCLSDHCFETHRRHCDLSLSKTLYPCIVLVHSMKTVNVLTWLKIVKSDVFKHQQKHNFIKFRKCLSTKASICLMDLLQLGILTNQKDLLQLGILTDQKDLLQLGILTDQKYLQQLGILTDHKDLL